MGRSSLREEFALRRLIVSAAAVASISVAALLPALRASASTSGCTSGTYAGYCGTQSDAEAVRLSFDVRQQGAFVNNLVIAYPNSATDPAADFLQLAYRGNIALGTFFEYAPGGIASNLCMSDPGGGYPSNPGGPNGIVLRTCNGSGFQRWVAAHVPGDHFQTWKNLATGKIIRSNGRGRQLTDVPMPNPPVPANYETWEFAG